MIEDPLLTTLLDLQEALDHSIPLIVAGGYGLFLKQIYLGNHRNYQTLFSFEVLPGARTTRDIDIILQAEIVTSSEMMGRIRTALDQLGFQVVNTAKYTQFVREIEFGKSVKIDLLAAPLGHYEERVKRDRRRVKPVPGVQLHASKLEEALGVERFLQKIPVSGRLSTGMKCDTHVFVPHAFPYLLTKIFAFRDQEENSDRDHGRHHALDVYRIVGMITEDEYEKIEDQKMYYAAEPTFLAAQKVVQKYFSSSSDVGCLRIREHALFSDEMDLDIFVRELKKLVI